MKGFGRYVYDFFQHLEGVTLILLYYVVQECGSGTTWDDIRHPHDAHPMTTDEERRFESQLAGLSLVLPKAQILQADRRATNRKYDLLRYLASLQTLRTCYNHRAETFVLFSRNTPNMQCTLLIKDPSR